MMVVQLVAVVRLVPWVYVTQRMESVCVNGSLWDQDATAVSLVFGDWVIMPKVDAKLAVVTLVVRTRGTVNKLRASVAAVKVSREESAIKSRPGISSLYQIT